MTVAELESLTISIKMTQESLIHEYKLLSFRHENIEQNIEGVLQFHQRSVTFTFSGPTFKYTEK